MLMALLAALAAMGISTTSRRPAMAPAPLEPARRDGHGDSARRSRIARQPTQFSIYCGAAAGAANTTTNDPHDPEGAHGQAEPRQRSMLELMARSATSGRDILSPMEKRPLSQWGGGLSANPTWSAIQRPHGPELHTEQPGRAPEHETTRPRSPNRSPLPALPTHPTPAMLTCDARPRSLSGNSTKMKLDPHNYNFKKKTCIGPPPPERIQNPPKNSRNRSGPPNIDPHNFNPQKKTLLDPPSKKKSEPPEKP